MEKTSILPDAIENNEKEIYTIIVSRHSEHLNDNPTDDGLEEVRLNSENTKAYLQSNGISLQDTNTYATNTNRTKKTANAVYQTLTSDNGGKTETKELSYLNLNDNTGSNKIKEMMTILNREYEKDPDVAKFGYSDKFVEKFQNNEIEGVDFNQFAVFYMTKLYNNLLHITTENDNHKNIDFHSSILGIHGGYFRESVLFGLFSDNMPDERKGQIKMGEQAVLRIVKNEIGKYDMRIWYRDKELPISVEKIKEKINSLKQTNAISE